VISVAENSNKFPRTRFSKEKSDEDVVSLGPKAQATLVAHERRGFFLSNHHPHDEKRKTQKNSYQGKSHCLHTKTT
jgi:hypothetical protein